MLLLPRMATDLARLLLVLCLTVSICEAVAIPGPISDSHRSAALELFAPRHGSFASLEEAYEALRVFEILAIGEKPDVGKTTCKNVLENLGSSTPLKDLYYALKVNGILKCKVNGYFFKDTASRLKAALNDASTLVDMYYSIGILVLIKDQASDADVLLADADGTFHSIKALSQSDGRWRYSSDNPESSTYAAGLALEALAGVITLASSEVDQSRVNTVKNDILKLFDSIEKYDDGTFYFDEKFIAGREHQGSISTTSSVVRGVTAFAAVTPGKINLPGDKILGLAKFFLGIGIPGDTKDFFNQVESLAFLDSNRISIPLVLSLPTTVYSLSNKDQLKRETHKERERKMGNCQAIDTATLEIQQPNGKIERLYWPVSASEVMKTNPGHYVALLISTTLCSSKDNNNGDSSNNNNNNQNQVRLTRIKLLKPTDTLVLGQVYRLISAQEVMKGIWAKKQAKMKKNLSEPAYKLGHHLMKEKPGFSSEPEDMQETDNKHERQGSRTTASTNSAATAKLRTWQPSLKSISESAS